MTLKPDKAASRARLAGLCLGLALAAPLLVFVVIAGLRSGLLDGRTAFDLLTLKVAWGLAWIGGAAAVVALWAGVTAPRKAGGLAALGVLAAGATLGLFLHHFAQAGENRASPDLSTNAADIPVYSPALTARRAAAGAVPLDRWRGRDAGCPGLAALPAQVAPEVAGYALQEAGFDVLGFGVGRADGTRAGFWFGFTHDAVVRIRPGRTDVRVTAREDREDDGEACRLARRITATLQPVR